MKELNSRRKAAFLLPLSCFVAFAAYQNAAALNVVNHHSELGVSTIPERIPITHLSEAVQKEFFRQKFGDGLFGYFLPAKSDKNSAILVQYRGAPRFPSIRCIGKYGIFGWADPTFAPTLNIIGGRSPLIGYIKMEFTQDAASELDERNILEPMRLNGDVSPQFHLVTFVGHPILVAGKYGLINSRSSQHTSEKEYPNLQEKIPVAFTIVGWFCIVISTLILLPPIATKTRRRRTWDVLCGVVIFIGGVYLLCRALSTPNYGIGTWPFGGLNYEKQEEQRDVHPAKYDRLAWHNL